jgi:hypothetical protein
MKMPHPAGYIDIMSLTPPPKKTLRGDVADIVRRFGGQLFCTKHVMWALREEEHYLKKGPTRLYASVRPAILKMVKDGEIEVVKQGGRSKPGYYRGIKKPPEYKEIDLSGLPKNN